MKKRPAKYNRPPKPGEKRVVRLAGGNPQIAKGDGDEFVQAYIKAMPGWTRLVGKRLDAIINKALPKVRKAVKWNSPFYGTELGGWFLSYHVYSRFVKVCFYAGTSLEPMPPGESKMKKIRFYDVYEDQFDEAQFAKWVKQAAKLPGWKL